MFQRQHLFSPENFVI